jgi:hypothetical protein
MLMRMLSLETIIALEHVEWTVSKRYDLPLVPQSNLLVEPVPY